MKILHINSYFNGSIFYKNLYDMQVKNGLEIDVFVPVAAPYKGSKVDLGSYTTTSINHGRYDRLFFHLKHYKIYKDIVKKYNFKEYSLIHAHSLFSNGYIAMKLKKKYKLQYIVAVRNTDVNLFFEKMLHLRALGVKILEEANKIVFLSKSYRDLVIEKYVPENLKEDFYKKSVVIPNGIDDFWFQNISVVKKTPKIGELNLLYIGTVSKNKNLTTTIKAIENLKGKGINVKFTVVGSIRDENIYEIIKNTPWIKYISPKPKEDLLEVYRKNDIFVMPSIKETFGLVYAEAMSQGLPVIYSKHQGFDGQFEEGKVGFHVQSGNITEIAKKIKNIVAQYDGISENCLYEVNKFKWDVIEREYEIIYKEILARN